MVEWGKAIWENPVETMNEQQPGHDLGSADPEELRRTAPDRVVWDPTGGEPRRWDDPDFFWLNEQLLVVALPDGSALASWTSERLDPHVLRIGASRSTDGGVTFRSPVWLDGDGVTGRDDQTGNSAAWQVPVVSPSGRVYLLYTQADRPAAGPFGGRLRCRCSDDGGASWSPVADLPFAPSAIDSPVPADPPLWVSINVPPADAEGRPLVAYTRWASPDAPAGRRLPDIKQRHSQIELFRVDNLAENPAPADLELSWLSVEEPVTAPNEHDESLSFAQEPYIVPLPDGRLFMTLRTNRGQAWYALSEDGGERWSSARPLRDRDGGGVLPQCVSPCPIYRLDEEQYLFLFNNNDGFVFGADSRWDARNRRPAYLCRGRFDPSADQPIHFDEPVLFLDNDAVPWGPPGLGRLEAAAYPSLTTAWDRTILWYPDRKGFLLGKSL